MSLSTPLQTLKGNPLLTAYFSDEELELLAKHLRISTFPANTPIMKEGDPAETMMFLLHGSAEVRSQNVRLATLKPCSFFGESMFVPMAIRMADVITRERCSVAVFNLEQFKALKDESAETAHRACHFFTQKRKNKAADKERIFDRVNIWGHELTAWLEGGAPLRF